MFSPLHWGLMGRAWLLVASAEAALVHSTSGKATVKQVLPLEPRVDLQERHAENEARTWLQGSDTVVARPPE